MHLAELWPDTLQLDAYCLQHVSWAKDSRADTRVLYSVPTPPSGAPFHLQGKRIDWREGEWLTIDEELDLLESSLRRLKIEYDVYFGGGSKRPPNDTLWRVQNIIKRFGDSQKLNFSQRFKFNTLTQKYAIFSDLWRQKLKIKEEGYRRPQDALLAIAGLRTDAERAAQQALGSKTEEEQADYSHIACSDVEKQMELVKAFYDRMMTEKQKVGESSNAPFESFSSFLKKKTEQIRRDFKCEEVEYSLEVQNNQVKLKAKPKTA
jgi:hypothetical protein